MYKIIYYHTNCCGFFSFLREKNPVDAYVSTMTKIFSIRFKTSLTNTHNKNNNKIKNKTYTTT